MPDNLDAEALARRTRASRRSSGAVIVIAYVVLVVGIFLSLYFLVDYHPRSQASPDLVPRARVDQLEKEITELQKQFKPSAPAPNGAAGLYEQDLKRHEELLTELRTERTLIEQRQKEVDELLKEARETEERTRGAAALFLGVFGAIAALLLGQGYYQFRGWMVDADDALCRVEAVKPDVDAIIETRKSLEDHLPQHIEEVRRSLALDAPNPTAVASMAELDHLTYLSASSMRFQKDRSSEQAERYIQSLLPAARGHIARKNNADAEIRFQEFFRVLVEYPDAADKTTRANAHSYRAFVFWRMLNEMSASYSWVKQIKRGEAAEWHRQACLNIAQAHECDPNWEHAYFVEALLFTYQAVPDDVTDKNLRRVMRRDGLKKAIKQYEKIIDLGARQSQGFAAWQNLAYCWKLLAEVTEDPADYLAFKDRLTSYPTDTELRSSLLAGGKQETEKHFLWQAMLADEELFAQVCVDHDDYRKFWKELLTIKVTLRNWQDDLKELKAANPRMDKWILPG
jgi:hypothetical protein